MTQFQKLKYGKDLNWNNPAQYVEISNVEDLGGPEEEKKLEKPTKRNAIRCNTLLIQILCEFFLKKKEEEKRKRSILGANQPDSISFVVL